MLRVPPLAVEAPAPGGLPRGRLLAGAVRDDCGGRAEAAWRRRGRVLRRNPSRQERRPRLLQGRPGRRRPGPRDYSSTLYYYSIRVRLLLCSAARAIEVANLVLGDAWINRECVKRCGLL